MANPEREALVLEGGPTIPTARARLAERVSLARTEDGAVLDFFAPAFDAVGPAWNIVARVPMSAAAVRALRDAVYHHLTADRAKTAEPRVASEARVADSGPADLVGPEGHLAEAWLTPEEGRAFFDEHARKLTGMSGEGWLRRYDAGEYDAIYDDPDHPEVVQLELLIPFARQDA